MNIDLKEPIIREEEKTLLQSLENLPATCREVIKLYFYDKQSRTAIATELKISLSSVHNRLHRGIWLLKTQFAKKPKNPV